MTVKAKGSKPHFWHCVPCLLLPVRVSSLDNSCTAVYVIFGATGGIGTDLAKRLLAGKSTVILAADQGDKLSKLKEELGGGETKEIDVMNSKQVSSPP